MTFLELCQRLREEAGVSGSGPVSVANQTGEMKRLVNWIKSAWDEIQLQRKNWMWMRGEFSFQTTADDYAYSPSDAGITERFRRWDPESLRIFKTNVGVSNEFDLPYLPYNSYLRVYKTGPQPPGKPVCFSIAPNLDLLLGSKPDGIYTVSGEYWKSHQALVDNADVPEMPEEFHMYIVWTALEKYGEYEAAGEVILRAKRQQRIYKKRLEDNQLPMMEQAEPLC